MLQLTLIQAYCLTQITDAYQSCCCYYYSGDNCADYAAPAGLLIKNSCAAAYDAGACVVAEHVDGDAGCLLRWTECATPADSAGVGAKEAEVYSCQADKLDAERCLQRKHCADEHDEQLKSY